MAYFWQNPSGALQMNPRISYEEIAKDYKKRADSERLAGGKVEFTQDGSVLVVLSDGSEYFFHDWQGDDLKDRMRREEEPVLRYIDLKDLILAQAQNW